MIAWFLTTRLGRFMAWALAGVAALAAAWVVGRREGRQAGENQALQDKVKTWERINEADTSAGDDAADRAWLRNRGVRSGKPKRDL